jgi:hypothetical protein
MRKTLTPKPNKAKADMRKLINELKEQADELNTPSTFAAYSKLNRKVLAMEKDLNTMPDLEASHDLYWVIAFLPYIAVFAFIGQSYEMAILGEDVYWPINRILGTQEHKTFYFSLSAWYVISLIVIKSLIG